ncbi:histidine phosphatase family protein [Corynebacterium sp. 320]|uniref:histidine phosphatase family protein n=1 Tax=Corynebacterium TaxID=1716 RepID=UPI00125CD212|nr:MULTISPECIES: histidine phosphatase family protein [Corynebacterium]KAB1502386.1 histidine phosphatase family protein [Corynebacterium sp. 320]KAB1551779.1 histidine phosphatase family protein [Corynebacterium sp. 319]KAB3525993.1 histidine phosphatase family protein [Corynebacterium sp. 250]KAB3538774.1 histidine phosphatase family protein [Corynebacterium sp. 366]QNP92725.1 histidine phosphatase family protein [Corynebacterium zhongnanshanii]
MKGERRLVLVRHGQTEYNATGRMQGQLDTELSERGRQQVRQASEVLKDWDVSAVISSDLVRARETAEILASGWGTPVTTDPRLRETDLGRWQGASHAEIDRDYPGQRAYWRHDPQWAPPGGESRVQVAERAFSLVNDVMHSEAFGDGGLVVMVAHGGTIGALTARLLGLPLSHVQIFSGLGNVHWSQLLARPQLTSAPGQTSPPAIDGSTVPLVPSADPEWFSSPAWHLEGWNISASMTELAHGSVGTSNPDEGESQ